MANLRHLEILKRGPGAWNKWVQEGRRTPRDLSDAQLLGRQLRGVIFRETNLSYADLRKANLEGADLYSADLSNARLGGAKMTGAYLGAADLSNADLTLVELIKGDCEYANLSWANLKGADLIRADMKGADLLQANLAGADLTHASFEGTDLRHADLSGALIKRAYFIAAKITGCNFSGAKMESTIFAGVNLSPGVGLEAVNHLGPSEVSVSTLQRSGGNIPEAFLRGCGLADWEIMMAKFYRPSLTHAQRIEILYGVDELRSDPLIQFYSCFISYSHTDKEFARKLHDTLQKRGVRCWLDEHQLLPGDKLYDEINRGIRFWDKVLLCCSESSLQSWWVDNEIETAFEKEQMLRKERNKEVLALIPLNLDGHLLSPKCKNSKAAQIRTRLAADFTGWEVDGSKFERQLGRLLRALRSDAGGREVPPAPKL